MSPRHVVVVGGGITGLAAAHELLQAEDPPAVTVLEAADRFGGKIHTSEIAGVRVDEGPDAFLARVPWAVDLCRELGLADELVSPAMGRAYLAWADRLHPLPDGLVLGVPSGLTKLARSPLMSLRGKARAALEPLLPRRSFPPDDLGALISGRFGDEVLDRLVGPLLGSINAADPRRLSLAASAPQLAEVATRSRSLLIGLRAQRVSTDPARPIFFTLRSGLGTVVDRLERSLRDRGADLRLTEPAQRLTRTASGWEVAGHAADAVVLAVPAFAAAPLVHGVAPSVGRAVADIQYASVALVTLVIPTDGIGRALDGSGVLVPASAQGAISAVSWGSSKWDHWRIEGQAVLRVSVGRFGHEGALALDDEALVATVLAELRRLMAVRAEPTAVRVSRWPCSFPQYTPGHLARVDALQAALAESASGLALAGAAYRGVGIPACIRQGREAARTVLR